MEGNNTAAIDSLQGKGDVARDVNATTVNEVQISSTNEVSGTTKAVDAATANFAVSKTTTTSSGNDMHAQSTLPASTDNNVNDADGTNTAILGKTVTDNVNAVTNLSAGTIAGQKRSLEQASLATPSTAPANKIQATSTVSHNASTVNTSMPLQPTVSTTSPLSSLQAQPQQKVADVVVDAKPDPVTQPTLPAKTIEPTQTTTGKATMPAVASVSTLAASTQHAQPTVITTMAATTAAPTLSPVEASPVVSTSSVSGNPAAATNISTTTANSTSNVKSSNTDTVSTVNNTAPATLPPSVVSQLLVDYPTIQSTVQNVLTLLQQYGPLTLSQLEYNLPTVELQQCKVRAGKEHGGALADILDILVVSGLVNEGVVRDDNEKEDAEKDKDKDNDEDAKIDKDKILYYCFDGEPRPDVLTPQQLRDEIDQAHKEIMASHKRSQRLIAALSRDSASNRDNPNFVHDQLRSLLYDHPEIMQDPVYVAALKNCQVDVNDVERERRQHQNAKSTAVGDMNTKQKTTTVKSSITNNTTPTSRIT